MSSLPGRRPVVPESVSEFLASPRFTSVLSMAAIGMAFSTHVLRSTIGWPGLIGALCGLVVLAAASFIAQRHYIEWHGLLPISLIAFVVWCALTVLWTDYQWTAVSGVVYQVAFAFLGVYIALVRDTIQVVRAVGDVLRVLLTASLVLEVLSGILLDLPIRFLGIQGNIAHGGPIQGLFGTRNQLSIVALIAFVTFLVELRTRSVLQRRAIPSILLAVLCLALAHSPVIAAVLVVVAVATLALYGLRKVPPHARPYVQWSLAIVTLAIAVLCYVFRTGVINLLNARADFSVRYDTWIQMWQMIPLRELQGWGWVGLWRHNLVPFASIDFFSGSTHSNGLNAFLDVYLQTGLVGLVAFLVLLALAFSRAWVLASNKRTVVHVWLPLVLIALLSTSLFESSILIESGWLLVVVCAVKAAQSLSWRDALPHRAPTRAAEDL
ncbi:exopolysaccharide production protein [Microbacterium sp. STN6]|uniref:exopolysaccharide production protein n=1 Tax=Microbacterium sp. STN6 TaxID=2995588 RepID=UPI002260B7B1|nr:exopolysaccharide production protein [Microbacterium sp. STN6]MCX7521059.1 exopolysaccharide production protein [Microbacterium sp. STN6]